ncbi:MAG: NADH-quinone oxidoreductase subunit NuoN [Rhodospirillales bacterium]|jgi:NADH-quinone oxidoreductase subunit N
MPLADMPNLVPVLPEIFLSCAAMVLLIFGAYSKSESSFRFILGVCVIVLALAMLLLTIPSADGRALTFNGMFVSDPFAIFFKVLVLLASILAIVVARSFLERQNTARFEYGILILFATVGMMMMISANNLMSLYVGLELQSLSLYVLASFMRDDTRATEAGLKYFVLGALASGMLLYGSSLVYGFSGTTSFDELALLFKSGKHPSTGMVVGIVFILAGLAFKVSAVPFHMWTPDVYEGAPTPVTAFFSVGPKLAAMALFIRLMIGPFGGLVDQWQQIVVFISIASMMLGAFAAINQRNIKRLMAYSSIGHVGYALIGLAVGTEGGIRGILIYMAIYLFMTMGAFTCILCMRRGERMVEGIDDLAGLSKTHPMVAFALAVFMFSMAGIPPLAGFFGKLYIFQSAMQAELYTLAVLGVLSSVVGAFYYVRIVKIIYFDEVAEPLESPIGQDMSLVLLGTGLVVGLFFLYPSIILSNASMAAAALFGG